MADLSKFEIKKADLTEFEGDCIVNAANSGLREGGGVCGAIFKKAGSPELTAACKAIGGCPTGSAVITPGFRLKAGHIVHAVGPIWKGGSQGESDLLYSCYQASMQVAMENGLHSIGFPLISSGIFGYPKEEAWKIAITSITDFQRDHDYKLDAVIAVLDDQALRLGNSIREILLPE